MTGVNTNSRVHSLNFVSNNTLKSIKDIIRESGLDPSKMIGDSKVLLDGIRKWMDSGDLESVILEIIDPMSDNLIVRWDLEIVYDEFQSDNVFFVDTEQIKLAVSKAVSLPSSAKYKIVVVTKPGSKDISGWVPCNLRTTDGMVRQSFGTNIRQNEFGVNVSFWRER